MRLAVIYFLIASIATVLNIGAQELTIRGYHGPQQVAISVLVGTAIGLGVKYVLDKIFIFGFRARNMMHDMRTFGLYTFMGVITTAIFWAFEFGFNSIFVSKDMRYLGGLIGLAIGYWIKYRLDRRFVFRPEPS
jgi:putative flippase GtrA